MLSVSTLNSRSCRWIDLFDLRLFVIRQHSPWSPEMADIFWFSSEMVQIDGCLRHSEAFLRKRHIYGSIIFFFYMYFPKREILFELFLCQNALHENRHRPFWRNSWCASRTVRCCLKSWNFRGTSLTNFGDKCSTMEILDFNSEASGIHFARFP